MKKFNKFAAGGILNLAAKTGVVFFLAEAVGVWYFAAYVLVIAALVVSNFFYNSYVTFSVKSGKRRTFVKYLIALLIFYTIDATFVKLITDTGLHYLISIVSVTAIIFVVKFFVFDRIIFVSRPEDENPV